jgi:hypothetical protein
MYHSILKLDNPISDKGCIVLNEILLSSKIEKIHLEGNLEKSKIRNNYNKNWNKKHERGFNRESIFKRNIL